MILTLFGLLAVMLPVHAQEDIDRLTKQARQESSSGDYYAASKDFEHALLMAKAKHEVVQQLACEEALAIVSEHQNQLDLTEKWLMEKVATLKRSDTVPLSGLIDLDSFYKRQQMPARRLETLRSLIAIWSTSVGPNAIGTGRYQAELGETLNLLHDSASAELPLRSALAVFEARGPFYARVTNRIERDLVHLIIDETGRPQQVQIIWPLGAGLDENAIKAVEKWRFRPALKDGVPVSAVANVEVSFKLL